MKKSKLSIGLMAALLSFATLTGCDGDLVKYSPEGAIISYYLDGELKTIKADDLFGKLIDESDEAKYQTIFDKLKSIIIRNYFYTDVDEVNPDKKKADGSDWKMGVDDLPQLEINAQNEVNKIKDKAEENASANKTSYEDELDTLLGAEGLKEKTLSAYKQKMLEKQMEDKFFDNFYKYCKDELSSGVVKAGLEDLKQYWTGYFKEAAPYHVSHILVKLSDSSESNYSNGTISEQDAKNLYKLVDDLANSGKTFATIAHDRDGNDSFDTNGGFGDLGIMDYNTTFIPEFQLGVFAYENLVGKYANYAKENESIKMPGIADEEANFTDQAKELKEEMDEAFQNEENTTIPSVPYTVFESLRRLCDATETTNNEKVMEGREIVYPRNTIYNRYLNRHSYAFITGTADGGELAEGFTGFHQYTENEFENSPLKDQIVLSVKTADGYSPILMVRGGNDSGNTYHGIHFIVINRSYFCDEDDNEVTRNEYYTTYDVDVDGYPLDSNNQPKKTYVNFNRYDSSVDNTEGRATEVLNKFKDFNSKKLNRYIFKKYMKLEGVKIDDSTTEGKHIAYGLEKWLNDQIEAEQKDFEKQKKEKWSNYVSMLRKQNDIRTRLISPAASIAFDEKANGGSGFKLTDEISKTQFEAYCDLIGLTTAEKNDASGKIGTFFADYYGGDWTWASKKVKVQDLYNVKGALFNDGNTYTK